VIRWYDRWYLMLGLILLAVAGAVVGVTLIAYGLDHWIHWVRSWHWQEFGLPA
jgi:hypothetical protein